MKSIVKSWRGFVDPDLSPIIERRLREAISRRQFLAGGAAVGLLYALMSTDYFKGLSDKEQDELIEASPEQLADLEIQDPEYIKAVQQYEKEMEGRESYKDEYEGLSASEIKQLQFEKVGALMIAPSQLEDGREWNLAPTSQSQAAGYYAYASEIDLDLISETNPEIKKAMNQAYDFYKNFGITRLHQYVYGRPEFFSYTSGADANEGKLFATIEIDQKERDYLTGEMRNIKFRKLPLAWTLAQRVLVDLVSFMEAELEQAKNQKEVDAILEKYGVVTEYGKGYSKVSKYDVVKKVKRSAGNALNRLENETKISGKHSN